MREQILGKDCEGEETPHERACARAREREKSHLSEYFYSRASAKYIFACSVVTGGPTAAADIPHA